jgi:hypothetical protein
MIFKKTKKAQVTIFIIIGIVVLIGAGLIIVTRIASKEIIKTDIAPSISEVPVEFQPISDFVESCIEKTGKEAIKTLGLHGGYTDLDKYGIVANAGKPTESRAFLFNPRDIQSGIAYWQYFQSDNKCETDCFCGSEKPSLYKKQGSPNIEKQIEQYINEKLKFCLDDFKTFEQQGFLIKAEKDIETTVTIRESNVLLHTRFKINAKKGNSEFETRDFITNLPVELEKIYNLASKIIQEQSNHSFMDQWTLEQISSAGLGLNQNRLPPIAASELDSGKSPVYWVKEKVKKDISKNMLSAYTPMITVLGADNFNEDLINTFYERAILILGEEETYPNLDVEFNYLNWWPIYFDITGRGVSGQRIGPETASSSYFSFIGIKRYNFYYDLSYPVLIDIYDKEAFNGEGLHFYVGFESNIRNNRPLNCSGPGVTNYATPSGSLFCNINQGCANITIETVDAKTNQPLEDVIAYYSSGLETCDKGFTKLKDNKAILKTTLPQCVGQGCSLNLVKEGYWGYPTTYATRCNKLGASCSQDNILCNEEKLKIYLEPYRNPKIQIKKKKMVKKGREDWEFENEPQSLTENEYAVIMLEKIKQSPVEEDLVLTAILEGNQTTTDIYPGMIPGDYKLTVNLFYKFPDSKNRTSVVFKAVEECQDMLFDEECVTIGPYEFNETVVEGNYNTTITINQDMLDNYDNLVFYALSALDIDSSYDVLDVYDLGQMSESEEYSNNYKVQLKPTVE